MKAEYLQHKDGTRFVPITQPDAVIDSEGKSLTTTLAAMEAEIEDSGKVDDVKVDGTSVVTDKVANIDLSGKVDTTDSRLSDARTPLAHTHAISEVENLQSSLTALEEADSALSQNLQGKFDTPQSKTIEGFGITDAYTKTEVDTKVSAKQNALTTDQLANLNADHSKYLTEHQDISSKADKATTLSGYGITDAYTKSEVDTKVSAKQDTMLTATSIAESGLVDNTKYTLGEISTLNLTTIPTTTNGILIYFSTPSTGCTLTYSANTNWLGSDAPSVEASKNYVVLIADGVCGINEYEPQTQS